ncbi:MAG: endo-1,4-beta-xylanase [Armatimonadota bacterium]
MFNRTIHICALTCLGILLPLMLCAEGVRPTPSSVPAVPVDGVGINMHPERYDDKTAELHFKLVHDLGITQIRSSVEWQTIQPRRGEWDFSKMDRIVALAKKYDMKILGVLAYNTPWNTNIPGNTKTKPVDMKAWAEFVKRMAERYRNDITWWEVWNEPNIPDFFTGDYEKNPEKRWTDYRDIIKAAYQALKSVNPKNTVIFAGLAHVKDDWWNDLEAYYRVGAVKYCDVMAIHPYASANPLDCQWYPRYIDEMLAVMARHGDSKKPVWLTEVGFTTNRHPQAISEVKQASYLPDMFLVALSRKQIDKVFLYSLVDDAEGFGIYNADWTPKLAADSMKRLMNKPVTPGK